jgi:hypothetical protein
MLEKIREIEDENNIIKINLEFPFTKVLHVVEQNKKGVYPQGNIARK